LTISPETPTTRLHIKVLGFDGQRATTISPLNQSFELSQNLFETNSNLAKVFSYLLYFLMKTDEKRSVIMMSLSFMVGSIEGPEH